MAGALNIGDSDHTLALRLASAVITEQPYAPIASTTLELVRKSLRHARLLILCPTPFGPGNLALLQEAVHFAQHGGIVVLLTGPGTQESRSLGDGRTQGDAPTEERQSDITACDYTGGEATRLLGVLMLSGALEAGSIGEVLGIVKKCVEGAVNMGPFDNVV